MSGTPILSLLLAAVLTALLLGIASRISTKYTQENWAESSSIVSQDGCFLDKGRSLYLIWKRNGTTVEFTLTVPSSLGWVGLGFSHSGGMPQSDMVIIEHLETDTPSLTDSHTGEAYRKPIVDAHQDWIFLARSRAAHTITVTATRRAHLSQPEEDIDVNGSAHVIYAYGTSNTMSYHGPISRGSKRLDLSRSSTVHPCLSDGENQESINQNLSTVPLELTAKEVSIPEVITSYWCTLYRVPSFDTAHHVISSGPLIQKNSSQYVHHMLIRGCFHTIGNIHGGDNSYDCFGDQRPADFKSCEPILFTWAGGEDQFDFPVGVGYMLGSEDSPKYLLLEIHYNNPTRQSGVVDSSGIRLVLTPKLRRHSAGLLQVGNTFGLLIPPRSPVEFTTPFWCAGECTQSLLPKSGVQIFATTLHAHKHARKISLRHYRNQSELPEIARNDYYSSSYQSIEKLLTPRALFPGDAIQVTCSMNSSNVNTVTTGGVGAADEMCMAFVWYYPQMKLTNCGTWPEFYIHLQQSQLYRQLGMNITASDNHRSTMQQYLHNVTWDSYARRQLQVAYYEEKQYCKCVGRDNNGNIQVHGKAVFIPPWQRRPNISSTPSV